MPTQLYSLCDHCHQKTFIQDMNALKCESCGAPLTEFHRIDTPSRDPQVVERVVEREVIREVPVEKTVYVEREEKSSKKKKRKKSKLKRLADMAEDIFDIFD